MCRSFIVSTGFALALLGASFLTRPAMAGPVYDAAGAFETGWLAQTNPNGVWSYGYSSNFLTPVTLYNTTAQPGLNGPNTQFWYSPAVNIGGSPSLEYNDGGAYSDGNINFLADELVLVAGVGGQYSDIVFTAPTTSTYSIAGSFRGDQQSIGTVVGISDNGTLLFNSSVNALGQVVSYNDTISLTAGQTIEFSVGPGGGTQNTGVSITITDLAGVPAPGAMALLGVGLAGLGAMRRKKHG